MSDLISRQAAIDAIEGITSSMSICVNSDECHGMKRMQRQAVLEIANMPSIQPKRGRWIDREENMEGMTLMIKRCSECGASKPMKIFSLEDYKFNFCPSCGADMRGDNETL